MIGNICWNIYLKNDFTLKKMKLVNIFLVKVNVVKDVLKKLQFYSYGFKLIYVFANYIDFFEFSIDGGFIWMS